MEVRVCDDETKGRGAFASRALSSGAIAGVYWGEILTTRAKQLRHPHPQDPKLVVSIGERRHTIASSVTSSVAFFPSACFLRHETDG